MKRLSDNKSAVISLGGGTITNKNNFDLLKKTGKIIYLKVSPGNLYRRLKNKIDRPLFKDMVLAENSEEDFMNKITEMLEKRREYYEKADLIIETDSQTLGKTVDKLAKKIDELFDEKD